VFDQIVVYNQHTPDMMPEVDRDGLADFVQRARSGEAVLCEGPEALLLATEWRRLGLSPVPTMALAVGGFLRLDAMRRWYRHQGRADPWPYLRDAPWLSWVVASSFQERHLEEQGVDRARIFPGRGCSEVFGLFSNDAGRLLAGGLEVDRDLAKGLPTGGVLLPGGGRRDHVTALKAVSHLPELKFFLVDELLPRKQHQLRRAGVGHQSHLYWLKPVALERFIALVKRARIVVVCLKAGSGDGGHTTVATAHRVGVPVVVTDVPGIRDYVTDGVDARLVPPEDPVALAAAIEELWRDKGLVTRLTAAGRLREKERCQTVRATFLDALESACAGLPG
jgi:glycosyltransferase involved in cell wall biosynthesis